jgi:glucose-6-phosphate 1-dehydrogenase
LVKDPSSESAAPVHLDVSFGELGKSRGPYERLLGDALIGDCLLYHLTLPTIRLV